MDYYSGIKIDNLISRTIRQATAVDNRIQVWVCPCRDDFRCRGFCFALFPADSTFIDRIFQFTVFVFYRFSVQIQGIQQDTPPESHREPHRAFL